jgi:predicted nucleic acid-binding protein
VIVVADAGPIVHLHWVGAAEWALPPGQIHVVDAVWAEVARHAPAALTLARLVRAGRPSADAQVRVGPFALDAGETEAIAFALSAGPDALVLCDERAARLACTKLQLAVVGSVGLIIEACKSGRADRQAATEALRALPTHGRMHVAPAIVERAIEVLGGDR